MAKSAPDEKLNSLSEALPKIYYALDGSSRLSANLGLGTMVPSPILACTDLLLESSSISRIVSLGVEVDE